MRARVFALALALGVTFGRQPTSQAAEPVTLTAAEKDAAARASFHDGELAEKERRYADALRSYRAVLATDPGNWFSAAARSRVEVLVQYEGAFAELGKLDAVRKDPAKVDDRGAIEGLEREARAFAPRTRAEALLFVAEAWVGRLREPQRAADAALTVGRDERVDRVLRDAAWDLAWAALKTDLPRAVREIAHDPGAPAVIRERVLRDARRAKLHQAATVVTAAAGLGLLAALGAALRRGRGRVVLAVATHPLAVVFLFVTPVIASVLADAWEQGFGRHFAPLSAALVGVHLLAAALRGALGDRGRALRFAGGALAASAMLAAAYLVLERSEAQGTPLLTSFGL